MVFAETSINRAAAKILRFIASVSAIQDRALGIPRPETLDVAAQALDIHVLAPRASVENPHTTDRMPSGTKPLCTNQ